MSKCTIDSLQRWKAIAVALGVLPARYAYSWGVSRCALLILGWRGSPGAPPPQANVGLQRWQAIAVALGVLLAVLAALGTLALRVHARRCAKSAPGSTDPEVGKWLVRAHTCKL